MPEQLQLLFISRLSPIFAIVLVGATFAVAGIALQQIVLKNHFIELNILSAAQSVAMRVLLTSVFLPASSLLFKMSFATVSALLGMGLFMLLIRRLPPHQPLMLLLIRITFGNIIKAITIFIAYKPDSMQVLSVWFASDFSRILADIMNCSG